MDTAVQVPLTVLSAYGLEGAAIDRLGGLINHTYDARLGERRAIVQRLHPIFDARVNLDIEAVTGRLAAQGLVTPRLLRTRSGELDVEHEGGVWRALSYVEGVSLERLERPAQARAAGAAAARFHLAMDGFEHAFHFTRAGIHDTAAHLARLREVVGSSGGSAPEAAELGERILSAAEALDLAALEALPRRICHGDLKVSNLRYADAEPPVVLCLVDLDTLGHQSIAYELGDALRSWCNPHTEDAKRPGLDADLLEASIEGYAAVAPDLLAEAEVESIVPGLHAVCLELSSRFCRDAVEDSYFGWDPSRYPSRRAHNLARARSQLALASSVQSQRARLEPLVRGRFPR